MLEAFLSGGYWPEGKCFEAGVFESSECRGCGHHKGDAYHLLRGCPRNCDINGAHIRATQGMVPDAEAGVADTPCLWLRGLVPKGLTAVTTSYPEGPVLTFFVRVPCGSLPGGVYWTDGSGGKNDSGKALRRCGSGFAVVAMGSCGKVQFEWGGCAPLHGSLQTVPRAELNACNTIIAKVSPGVPVELVTDSLVNFRVYDKGPGACAGSSNNDMWSEFCDHSHRIGDHNVKMRWVKAHATCENILKGDVSILDLFGNACADALAGRAGKQADAFPQDAVNVL